MTPTTVQSPREALPRIHRTSPLRPAVSVALIEAQSAERQALESSITQKFQSVYGAQLNHFLPQLLRLRVAEELGAVIGMRAAQAGPLFLEQYTDRRVEQFIAAAFETPVARNQVVEIGNLAADVSGHAYTLFAVLATLLNEAGFRWVACTATPQVESMLARMQFPFRTICSADPQRLQAKSADWGDYYTNRPNVIVGDVREAAAQVAANPDMSMLAQQFAQAIAAISSSLKTARS